MGENLAQSYSSDKGLTTRIYTELKNLNSQRIINPVKKWVHKLNKQFSKEGVQMASKYTKKCSTSLALKERQIKTILVGCLWLMPVFLGTSRAEIRRIIVQSQPRQIVCETLSQKYPSHTYKMGWWSGSSGRMLASMRS
jgi:hypothetical protein